MQECGFEEQQAIEALYPLILSNIDNIKNLGIVGALTGPVERGDAKTVERHLKVIPEEHRKTYTDLSSELLQISKNKNPERDYSPIQKCLKG
jgi:predicted short-subunit dehydrogenase-like oxidoreductase (DUF2520 family)